MLVLAMVCGVLTGAIGFVPLYLGLRLRKKMIRAHVALTAFMLISCMVASCVILVLASVAFLSAQKEQAFPFAVAAACSLSATAIAYGLSKSRTAS